MSNQNNLFGNLTDDGLEKSGDRLGGGGVFDAGVYDGTIALAYAGESSGGAKSMTYHIQIGDRQYRETVYITSGREKGQKNYYEKDGKKSPLPGFTTANDLALLSTGNALADQDFQEKVVNLYDFDAKAEIPKKVMVAVDMIGKPITVAILKILENKSQKNETTGQYEPTEQTRETNNIDKVFHTDSGKTLSEYVGKKDPEFKGKWETRNAGQIVNKVKEVGGKTGIPGQRSTLTGGNTGGTKPKSLFG